ncbi:MAG: CPBP family glutamic-type intramembrane protease, partial [Vulcanimicrobiaceae bacterium]
MKRSMAAAAIVWLVSELLMLAFDRNRSWIGPATLAYLLLLWLFVAKIVDGNKAAEESVLTTAASGGRLWLRILVVLATLIAVCIVYTVWFGGYIRLPWLGSIMRGYTGLFGPNFGQPLFNFSLYALIPGVLLLALGMRPNEAGLTSSASRTWIAALPCLALPAAFIVLGFYRGTLTMGFLATLIVHSLLGNGFSEEFLMRGMTLSHLRAFMRTGWALFVQAVIYAVLHYGAAI